MPRNNTDPRPADGYAFKSSRRWPREPEIIMAGRDEWRDSARFVGTARIDGAECNAWRVTDPDTGRRCYLFQTRIGG